MFLTNDLAERARVHQYVTPLDALPNRFASDALRTALSALPCERHSSVGKKPPAHSVEIAFERCLWESGRQNIGRNYPSLIHD